jgi:acetyl esterase/lipase
VKRLVFAALVAIPALLPSPASAGNTELDIVYAIADDGHELHADVRFPKNGGPFPALVLIHGGGFLTGDENSFTRVANDLRGNGYLTLAIEYTLATPETKGTPEYFATALRDVSRAVDYLATRSDVDTSRIGMFGASSGAVLAELFALGDDRLRAVIGYSGTVGDPPPPASVTPAPLFAAHSTKDRYAPYSGATATQQYWESLGSPHELYSTNQDCHALCFWTHRDPILLDFEARNRTLSWLNRYVKNG